MIIENYMIPFKNKIKSIYNIYMTYNTFAKKVLTWQLSSLSILFKFYLKHFSCQ